MAMWLKKLIDRCTDLENVPSFVLAMIHGYDYSKYWRRREIVINPSVNTCLLVKLYYLWRIKRIDGSMHCSFGTNLNYGASFFTPPPHLPHGPYGIIVGHDAVIGANITIYQQVTIAAGGVTIGDNVVIYPGAKILSHVTIGNNCKVGANAIVVEDMPDNSTCVLPKPRIILK